MYLISRGAIECGWALAAISAVDILKFLAMTKSGSKEAGGRRSSMMIPATAKPDYSLNNLGCSGSGVDAARTARFAVPTTPSTFTSVTEVRGTKILKQFPWRSGGVI